MFRKINLNFSSDSSPLTSSERQESEGALLHDCSCVHAAKVLINLACSQDSTATQLSHCHSAVHTQSEGRHGELWPFLTGSAVN